ncbi:unnamed protein product [Prunus armeniaca]|uniref:Uncharacterized protein n=1 Tax=Prunus armeniaca TaxID=36596 RepID=A0A6J5X898_PRUAR|nr:unnamed protein product [Prunus armeniaca]
MEGRRQWGRWGRHNGRKTGLKVEGEAPGMKELGKCEKEHEREKYIHQNNMTREINTTIRRIITTITLNSQDDDQTKIHMDTNNLIDG